MRRGGLRALCAGAALLAAASALHASNAPQSRSFAAPGAQFPAVGGAGPESQTFRLRGSAPAIALGGGSRSFQVRPAVARARAGGESVAVPVVFVGPDWRGQGDVLADGLVGPGGSAPPAVPLRFGHNAHADLESALAGVAAGGRVVLLPGVHAIDGLVLSRRVEISGIDGEAAVLRPRAALPAGRAFILVETPGAAIRRVRISGAPPDSDLAGADIGIDAAPTAHGLVLEGVAIEAFAVAGVRASGPGLRGHEYRSLVVERIGSPLAPAGGACVLVEDAEVRILDALLADGPAGVVAQGRAVLEIEDSRIERMQGAAIRFERGAAGSARGNRIADAEHGIVVADNARGRELALERNDLTGPMRTGIWIQRAGGDVLLRGNQARSPVDEAAYRLDAVDGEAARVRIIANRGYALAGAAGAPDGLVLGAAAEVADFAAAALAQETSGAGVRVLGTGIQLSDLDLANWRTGLVVGPDAQARLEDSTLDGNLDGVALLQGGELEATGLEVFGGRSAVRLVGLGGARLELSDSRLEGFSGAGIDIQQPGARVRVEDSVLAPDPAADTATTILLAGFGAVVDFGGGALGSAGRNRIGAAAEGAAIALMAPGDHSAARSAWSRAGSAVSPAEAFAALFIGVDPEGPLAESILSEAGAPPAP